VTGVQTCALPILGGLALLWILPFLWAQHWYPMTSLYGELVSALCLALAILSCSVLKKAEEQLNWPFPVLMLVLIALALIQRMTGMLAYAQLTERFLLFIGEMLTAYAFGRQIVALGLTREAVKLLSFACVAGAAYSVFVQWLQLFDLEILPIWLANVYPSEAAQQRPFGNLGQSNQQATYLAMGAIAMLYLGRPGNRRWLVPAILFALATGLALTGSRMGAVFLLLLMSAQFAPSALRPETRLASWLGSAALICGYLFGLVAVRLAVGDFDTLTRATQGTLPLRFELWWQGWQVAAQHHWLGIGVGQFGGGQYWVARASPFTVPANNCHNAILQLAAELGWPAALFAAWVWLYWGVRNLRARLADPEQAVIWSMVLAIAIHSQLEFPLWHLYFAIPGSLLFALGEPACTAGVKVDLRRVFPVAGVATIVIAAVFGEGYVPVAQAAAPVWLEAMHLRQRSPFDALPIIAVADSKLFKPEVERLVLDLKHPSDEHSSGPLDRSARLLRVLPAPEIMAQHIVLLAQAGRIDEAIAHAGRLRVFAGADYTGYRDSILEQTRSLGPQTAPLRHLLREPLSDPSFDAQH